jgi:hypothetical protein
MEAWYRVLAGSLVLQSLGVLSNWQALVTLSFWELPASMFEPCMLIWLGWVFLGSPYLLGAGLLGVGTILRRSHVSPRGMTRLLAAAVASVVVYLIGLLYSMMLGLAIPLAAGYTM